MVRAGVVSHPEQWFYGGYREIQRPRRKNILIDYETLGHLCGFGKFHQFQSAHRTWVESALTDNEMNRKDYWTRSIAVGNRSYVEAVKYQMGGSVVGRQIRKNSDGFELREDQSFYNAVFDTENEDIGGQNQLNW